MKPTDTDNLTKSVTQPLSPRPVGWFVQGLITCIRRTSTTAVDNSSGIRSQSSDNITEAEPRLADSLASDSDNDGSRTPRMS